ncbi:MAG: HEAT repeat domain-containing protein [Firmicutes bacterium]|nr:HEAT repeat domain-containing protein [Bacillota bacterium]
MSRTSWRARLQAVQEIVRSRDPSRRGLLIDALKDRSNFVVAASAEALAASPGEDLINPLMERYRWFDEDGKKRDVTCVARIAIVSALVACRAVEAGDIYLRAIRTSQIEPSGMGLEDVAVPLRIKAANALAEFRIPGALVALAILLVDDTAAARLAAIQALHHLGDPGAVALLAMRLAEPGSEDPEVLVACMDALVSLDPQTALQVVSPFLSDADPYLVAGAATALAGADRFYHEKVLALLEESLNHTAAEAREAVVLAMASMRSDAVTESLSRLTDHPKEAVRLAAVRALEQRADPQSVHLLEKLADRPSDRRVCQEAKRILARLAPL